MADKTRKWTDRQLKKMIKRLEGIYADSLVDLTHKWNDYMQNAAKRLEPLQKAYDDAKKSGDKDLIEETGRVLGQVKRAVTMQDNYYKSMVNNITTRIAYINQSAVDYLNGEMPNIYAHNFNAINADAKKYGIRFDIVNEDVVKNLVVDGKITLPKKKINIPKDKRWNTKIFNDSVLQGILQGESMDKIAARILPEISKSGGIIKKNKEAAIRNARTMVTGAENRGRRDSYRALENEGAVMSRVWIATPDSRTRDFHLSMDGQEVGVDEPFIDGHGNELQYPGDPSAPAETVYNCRCTQKSNIIGFRKPNGRIDYINYDKSKDVESLHSRQLREERAKRGK